MSFHGVFSEIVHPILFSIGPLSIYSFGTLIALGYLVAAFLLWHDLRRQGRDHTVYLDLGIGLIVAAFVGGRGLYVLLHYQEYLEDPLEILKIHHGGLVFYGGLAGAFLFGLLWIKKKRLRRGETMDTLIPYAVLVHAFGRIGCFLNGCCYGRPTALPFGIFFPNRTERIHPTQLYESFFLFLLFILLRNASLKKVVQDGSLFLVYLLAYGLFRFAVEFLRGDQTLYQGVSLPQLSSIVLVGLSLFFWGRRRGEP